MIEIKLRKKEITMQEVFEFVDTLGIGKTDGVVLKTLIYEIMQNQVTDILKKIEKHPHFEDRVTNEMCMYVEDVLEIIKEGLK